MTTAAAWFAVAVGVLMALWWAVEVRTGVLHRPDRQPVEIGLHLSAELLTATLLAAGGIVVLAGGGTQLLLVAFGMVLYTLIESPGYFLARRESAPVAMFAVLLVLTLGAVIVVTTA